MCTTPRQLKIKPAVARAGVCKFSQFCTLRSDAELAAGQRRFAFLVGWIT
jgi:hypothetical protein